MTSLDMISQKYKCNESGLKALIANWSKLYYEGSPVVSDQTFDEHVKTYTTLFPDQPLPTGWGYVPENSHLQKFDHPISVVGITNRVKQAETTRSDNHEFEGLVASLKLDGISAAVYYKDGKLDRILSRGDGKVGLDITQNLRFCDIPTTVDHDILTVRGELIISYEDFEGMDASHPRNKASGLSQSITSLESELKTLQFIAYSLELDDLGDTDKVEVMNLLYQSGFKVTPYWVYSEWSLFYDTVEQGGFGLSAAINTTGYGTLPIDGMVVTDVKNHHKNLILKFTEQSATTTVQGIEWQVSRTGRVVPVACLNPVSLSGATIGRVTLNNVEWLKEMGCGIGSTVEIVRSNEVIPMIISTPNKVDPQLPENCPICDSELERDSRDLKCVNPVCDAKLQPIFYRMFELGEVDGLGESRLTELIEWWGVNNLDDLRYLVYQSDPSTISDACTPAVGKLYTQLLANLRTREYTIADVIYIANVPKIGDVGSRALALSLTLEEFRKGLSTSIPCDWNVHLPSEPAYQSLVEHRSRILKVLEMLDGHLKEMELNDSSEAWIQYSMTGKLSMKRPDFLSMMLGLGAKFVDPRNADFFIANNPSSSSKYKQAEKLGLNILDEETAVRLVRAKLEDELTGD